MYIYQKFEEFPFPVRVPQHYKWRNFPQPCDDVRSSERKGGVDFKLDRNSYKIGIKKKIENEFKFNIE
jgi:hypothetical protein